ncbi:unnamed protein product [Sphagnum troendelagicum]
MKKDLGCLSKEAYGNAVLSSIEFPEDAATPLHREGKVRAFWMQTDSCSPRLFPDVTGHKDGCVRASHQCHLMELGPIRDSCVISRKVVDLPKSFNSGMLQQKVKCSWVVQGAEVFKQRMQAL